MPVLYNIIGTNIRVVCHFDDAKIILAHNTYLLQIIGFVLTPKENYNKPDTGTIVAMGN